MSMTLVQLDFQAWMVASVQRQTRPNAGNQRSILQPCLSQIASSWVTCSELLLVAFRNLLCNMLLCAGVVCGFSWPCRAVTCEQNLTVTVNFCNIDAAEVLTSASARLLARLGGETCQGFASPQRAMQAHAPIALTRLGWPQGRKAPSLQSAQCHSHAWIEIAAVRMSACWRPVVHKTLSCSTRCGAMWLFSLLGERLSAGVVLEADAEGGWIVAWVRVCVAVSMRVCVCVCELPAGNIVMICTWVSIGYRTAQVESIPFSICGCPLRAAKLVASSIVYHVLGEPCWWGCGATMLLAPPPQVLRVVVLIRKSPSSTVAPGSGLGWVMGSLGQILWFSGANFPSSVTLANAWSNLICARWCVLYLGICLLAGRGLGGLW
jgi:hypothetical protein